MFKALQNHFEKRAGMNCKQLVTVGALLLFSSTAIWAADDGAALYKKRCGGCHGANGEGKPAMKAPALKNTTMDADRPVAHITNGESTSKTPHNKGMSGLKDEQAKAIADYVKTLS